MKLQIIKIFNLYKACKWSFHILSIYNVNSNLHLLIKTGIGIKTARTSASFTTKISIVGALYTFGQNNPVIDGPIFIKGGLYHINVEVLGAGSVRSNLLDPLEYDTYVSIAQEHTFYIEVPDNLILDPIDGT